MRIIIKGIKGKIDVEIRKIIKVESRNWSIQDIRDWIKFYFTMAISNAFKDSRCERNSV